MNGELKDNSMKEEAWKLCKDFLQGRWKDTSLREFKFYEVRGGLSNTLYRCSLPDKYIDEDNDVPKEILLRIYGPIQDDPNVVVTEAVNFMLLSERKLGPKLYGLFPRGRLEEFIPSHSLSSDEIRKYSTIIAREMAKVHALEVPVRKVSDIWPSSMTKWINEVEEFLIDDKDNYFMSPDAYRNEIRWLTEEMKKANSPVVYCHNDLQGGNILFREDSEKNRKPNLMLIDFEFSGYNYRGYDIANHICEWCFDYDTPEYPHFTFNFDKFPSKEEQAEFCAAYLDQLLKEGVRMRNTLEEETATMMQEITLFACAAHLCWSLWSVKMILAASEGFGHEICASPNCRENQNCKTGPTSSDDRHWKERMGPTLVGAIKAHCKTRTELFHKFKEQYLAMSYER